MPQAFGMGIEIETAAQRGEIGGATTSQTGIGQEPQLLLSREREPPYG